MGGDSRPVNDGGLINSRTAIRPSISAPPAPDLLPREKIDIHWSRPHLNRRHHALFHSGTILRAPTPLTLRAH